MLPAEAEIGDSRLKDWLSSNLPDRDALLARRWLRPFAHRLAHPSLWHFNRWSVARGLALGLFVGILIPLGQIVLAALVALTFRANLLVAAAATLVSNPFTFPAIYFAAYRTGQRVLGDGPAAGSESALPESMTWLLQISGPTALGLFLFASLSALAGYGAVHFAWRLHVLRRRTARRAAGA